MKNKLLLSTLLATIALLTGESAFAVSGALDNTWYKIRVSDTIKPLTATIVTKGMPDTYALTNETRSIDTGQANASSQKPGGCYMNLRAGASGYVGLIVCYSTVTKSWEFMPARLALFELADTDGALTSLLATYSYVFLLPDGFSAWSADGKTLNPVNAVIWFPALIINPPTGKQKLPAVVQANSQNLYIEGLDSSSSFIYLWSTTLSKGGGNSFTPVAENEAPPAAKACVENLLSAMPVPMSFCVEDTSMPVNASSSEAAFKDKVQKIIDWSRVSSH